MMTVASAKAGAAEPSVAATASREKECLWVGEIEKEKGIEERGRS